MSGPGAARGSADAWRTLALNLLGLKRPTKLGEKLGWAEVANDIAKLLTTRLDSGQDWAMIRGFQSALIDSRRARTVVAVQLLPGVQAGWPMRPRRVCGSMRPGGASRR